MPDPENNMVYDPAEEFTANEYWDTAYQKGFVSRYWLIKDTEALSRDFITSMPPEIDEEFKKCTHIIEVGCGSGELSSLLSKRYYCRFVGLDFSRTAIEIAKEVESATCNFYVCDLFALTDIKARADMVIAFNVIEHFKDPFALLDLLFEIAPLVLVEVPYREERVHEIHEGAGWHCYKFDDGAFDAYEIIGQVIYESDGWKRGREWALLLQKKGIEQLEVQTGLDSLTVGKEKMIVYEREFAEYDIDTTIWAQPKPFGFSGCFRLRDESQFMRAAILSHLPYLDEAVLVVQPSKDDTLEIARELEKEYPDKIRVIYYPFDVHFIDHPKFHSDPENSIYSFVYLSNWALYQCRYSWIVKVEGDVICLPTIEKIMDRIRKDPQPWYYGLTVLNVAGEGCDQFSVSNPRNGGWDECVIPNDGSVYFVRHNKWEVLVHLLKATKMGWSGIHMKRCQKQFLPGPWNGEEYALLEPEILEVALEVHNIEKGYTDDPDPLGIPELYTGWQRWLEA